MKYSAILIFCGFVQSIPVIRHSQEPLYFQDVESNENEHKIVEKSVTELCPLDFQVNDNYEEPSRLSLPTVESLTNAEPPQEFYDDRGPEVVPMDMIPYALPLLWNKWTPYDMGIMQDQRFVTSEGVPYQMQPSYVLANPVTVRSLPPVFSTQIHETIPDLEESYEINDVALENAVYLTPNIRAVRSRDEEILDQLKHDAMIPNIIPTMPVPYFVRTASAPPVYLESDRDAPLMAVFPGIPSDCARTFLISCSPKIVYGTLAQNAYGSYGGYPVISPSSSEIKYTGHAVETHEMSKIKKAAACPPNEEMGSNMQCIIRRRTTLSNESVWNNYD